MSVLETPRIYFSGAVAWDPIVTNNYTQLYDEDAGESVLPSAATAQAQVQAFRQEAITSVMPSPPQKKGPPARNWNPHGTHRSVFYDSSVSGADLGKGVVTDDPFVASAASFSGMLVDLEPYGAFSSQLFFDGMRFGIDGGYRILLPRTARFTDRYINLGRNKMGYITGPFSVMWQSSFALSDGLTIDAFDSPALQALEAAMGEEGVIGLTVRWVAYGTYYYDTPALATDPLLIPIKAQELIDKLNGGGFQPNPARSSMVGMIGLWRAGEPASEPGDRALLATVSASPGTPSIQSAHARFNGNSLAIDLSNSTPEIDLALNKDQSFGDLTVVATDPDTGKEVAQLGTIAKADYDKAAYDLTSGVVTLDCDPTAVTAAGDANIVIKQSDGTAVLIETPLRVIPTVPNLYLVEDQAATITFQLYERGALAARQVPVTLYTTDFSGGTVTAQANLETDASGLLTVDYVAGAGEVFAYVPAPDNLAPPTPDGINPQANTFMYIRVLPADAATAALPPTWDNVYTNVLANWNAMAPCMDNWLMLDDPAQVKAYGPMLKALTDPDNFEAFRFMPVTRDMTPGGRTLLYNFLDAPDTALLSAVQEAPAAPRADPPEPDEPAAPLSPTIAAIQSMRSP